MTTPSEAARTAAETPRSNAMRTRCYGIAPHADYDKLCVSLETEAAELRQQLAAAREALSECEFSRDHTRAALAAVTAERDEANSRAMRKDSAFCGLITERDEALSNLAEQSAALKHSEDNNATQRDIIRALEKALENCYMIARRRGRGVATPENADWHHITRFCESVGLKPDILRSEPTLGK